MGEFGAFEAGVDEPSLREVGAIEFEAGQVHPDQVHAPERADTLIGARGAAHETQVLQPLGLVGRPGVPMVGHPPEDKPDEQRGDDGQGHQVLVDPRPNSDAGIGLG